MNRETEKHTTFDPRMVFAAAERFFTANEEDRKAQNIANYINDAYKPLPRLNRESVYPLLRLAMEKGYLQLVPPLEEDLSQKIANEFGFHPEDIIVVNADGPQHVSRRAAQTALQLIHEIHSASPSKRFVGLGLGPGRGTLDFSRKLIDLLHNEISVPRLKLFAIGTGCPYDQPEFAPISFFNLFPNAYIEKRIGFFAESIVTQNYFNVMKEKSPLSDIFKLRDEIDLVVTSMGDIKNEHDLLRALMIKAGSKPDQLLAKGWIGNVQFRPYGKEKPIEASGDEFRAVTLFEINEFVQMAEKKNKHVLLIARKCCERCPDRSAALRPLLESPKLKVWSKLVMDIATAKGLLTKKTK